MGLPLAAALLLAITLSPAAQAQVVEMTLEAVDPRHPITTIEGLDAVAVEESAGQLQLRVRLSGTPSARVTLSYQTVLSGTDSASHPQDYSHTTGTVRFEAGATVLTQAFSVPVREDTQPETRERFILWLQPNTGATYTGPQLLTAFILDNDMPMPTSTSVTEGEAFEFPFGNFVYGSHEVSVRYRVIQRSATQADFAAGQQLSGTQTIREPNTSVRFETIDDGLSELDETFMVEFTLPDGRMVRTPTLTIRDGLQGVSCINSPNMPRDCVRVYLEPISGTIKNTGVEVSEAIGQVLFRVTVEGPEDVAVGVRYYNLVPPVQQAQGNTRRDFDFRGGGEGGQLSFGTGSDLRTQTFAVEIKDDDVFEQPETFNIKIETTGRSAAIVGQDEYLVQILDNDPLRVEPRNGASAREGTALGLQVEGLIEADFPVNVQARVVHGTTENADIDSASMNQTVTFSPVNRAEVARPLDINLIDDNIAELDETFQVELIFPDGRRVLSPVLTILDAHQVSLNCNGSGECVRAKFELTSPRTVNENVKQVDFRLTLNDSPASPVTFSCGSDDARDSSGVPFFYSASHQNGDYERIQNREITFAAGTNTLSQTFSVEVLDDEAFEDEEFFTVSCAVSGGNAKIVGNGLHTIIIEDNDHLSFTAVNPEVREGQPIELTISGLVDTYKEITTYFQLHGTGPGDIVGDITSAVTIPPMNQAPFSETVFFVTTDDGVIEPDEIVRVGRLAGGVRSNQHVVNDTYPTVTILDSGEPGVRVLHDRTMGTTIEEGEISVAQITLELERPVTAKYTAHIETVDGDGDRRATSRIDYHRFSRSEDDVFGTGNKRQKRLNVSLRTEEDTIDEYDETYNLRITISGPNANAVGDRYLTVPVTILDDDVPPVLVLSTEPPLDDNMAEVHEEPGGNDVKFVVNLEPASGKEVMVEYRVFSGANQATAGSDYTERQTKKTLTFKPGETRREFVVRVLNDDDEEQAETFSVELHNPVNASIGGYQGGFAGGALEITIPRNDVPLAQSDAIVKLSGPRFVDEGDAGRRDVTYRAWMTGPAASDVIVDFIARELGASDPGPHATRAEDFGTGNKPLTIPAGSTSVTATLPIYGDTLPEGDEKFWVEIRPRHYTEAQLSSRFADRSQFVIIRDDDTPPTVSLGGAPGDTVQEGRFFDVTVTVEGTLQRQIQLSLVDAATLLTSNPDLLGLGPFFIEAGQTSVTRRITVQDDRLNEPSERLGIALVSPWPKRAAIGSPNTITFDVPGEGTPTLEIDGNPVVTVGEDAGSVDITLRLTGPVDRRTRVQYNLKDGSAVGGVGPDWDYVRIADFQEFYFEPFDAVEHTFRIPIHDDLLDENTESFEFKIVEPNANSNPNPSIMYGMNLTQTIRITDNDVPEVSFSGLADVGLTKNEGEAVEFTVTTTHASDNGINVYYSVAGAGTYPASSEDYMANGMFTIPAERKTATFTIDITDDDLDEYPEGFEVTLDRALTLNGAGAEENPGRAIFMPRIKGGETTSPLVIITDDDAPEVTVPESVSALENGNAEITVEMDNASVDDTLVKYTVVGSGVRPAIPEDFTMPSGEVTINAGQKKGAIVIELTNDRDDEGDETFTVTLTEASGRSEPGTAKSSVVTIVDDDVPTVTVSGPNAAVPESGTVTFTLTMNNTSDEDTVVDYVVAGSGSNPADVHDFDSLNSSRTISANNHHNTILIDILTDEIDEGDETFTLTLTGVSDRAKLGGAKAATVTITDDDAPVVTLSGPDEPVTEGDFAVFTVSMDHASVDDTKVNYTITGKGGNPAVAADYTDQAQTSGALTIGAGDQTLDIRLLLADDDLYEPTETLTVTLTGIEGPGGEESRASLGETVAQDATITDVDGAPTVAFVETASSVPESDGEARLAVQLGHATVLPVTVTWSAAGTGDGVDDSAATADDFTSLDSVTFTPDPETGAPLNGGDIVIALTNDEIDEPDELFEVTLTSAGGLTPAEPLAHTVTIANDDAPEVTIAGPDAAVTEGNAAAFTLSMDHVSAHDITVNYTITGNGDAPAVAADYTDSFAGSLTIDAGEQTLDFEITLLDDDLYEPPEVFTLEITGFGEGDRAKLGDPVAVDVTITDVDGAPTVSFVETESSVSEADGEARLAVQLGHPSVLPVTVTWSVAGAGVDDSAATTDDYTSPDSVTLTPDAATGAPLETGDIVIALTNDEIDEPDETFAVTLTSGDGLTPAEPLEHTVTITNDDVPMVTVAGPENAVPEGGTATFMVTMDHASVDDVLVNYTVDGTGSDAAASGDDFTDQTPNPGSVTIGAGNKTANITIAIADDNLYEPDETFTVEITGIGEGSRARLGDAVTAEVLIVDQDGDMPGIYLEGPDSGDEGETIEFTARLSDVSELRITVDYQTEERPEGAYLLSATPGDDYTASSGELVFEPGEQSATFQVSVSQDLTDEHDQYFRVVLANPSTGAVLGHPNQVTGMDVRIDDDDGPPSATVEGPTTVEEGQGVVGYRVNLNRASEKDPIHLYLFCEPGTATYGEDYLNPSGYGPTWSVEIRAGVTSVPMAAGPGLACINILSDNKVEGDETFTVILRQLGDDVSPRPSGIPGDTWASRVHLGDPHSLTVTIKDTGVEFQGPAALSVGEGDGTLALTVLRHGLKTTPLTVGYVLESVNPNGAEEGTDYDAPAVKELTFQPDEASLDIELSITDNELDEEDRSFKVTLVDTAGTAFVGKSTQTVTITDDDDAPVLAVTSATQAVSESDGTITVDIGLDNVSAKTVTVDYLVEDSGAAWDDDYSASDDLQQGTLTFEPNVQTRSIEFDIEDDALDELDTEAFTVTFSNPVNATLDSQLLRQTVTITDNDQPPELSLDGAASVSHGEDAGVLVFTARLNGISGREVTVDVSTEAPGSGTAATDGDDYQVQTPARLRFVPGETSQEIRVQISDDDLAEPDEIFKLVLSGEDGAELAEPHEVEVTITDNDERAVMLSGPEDSILEGQAATLTVTADQPALEDIVVNYTVEGSGGNAGNAAASDDDYTDQAQPPGSVTILKGEKTATIQIALESDQLAEPLETFTVEITGFGEGSRAKLGDTVSVEVMIADDNGAPSVYFVESATEVPEAGREVTLAIQLSHASTENLTISYSVAGSGDNEATLGEDFETASGTETIDATTRDGTITITLKPDQTDEHNETFTVTLLDNGNGILPVSPVAHAITITDDDPLPSVGITPVDPVGEDAGTVAVEVTLSAVSGKTVTVDYAVEDGTAKQVADYVPDDSTGYAGTLTFAPGEQTNTLGFSIVADTLDEADTEEFTVSLSAPTEATLDAQASRQAVAITDDDGAPTVTLEGSPDPVPEGDPAPFKVMLNVPSGLDVVVTPGVADGTAVSGTDYGDPAPASVTITAGETEGTFQVPTTSDELDEGPENFTVTIADADGNQLGSQVVTIADDDEPAVTIAGPSQAVLEDDTASLTVTMSKESVDDTVVDYTIAGSGTNPAGADDYTGSSGSFTITDGKTTYNLEIPLIADSLVEPPETFTVEITGASGRAGPGAPASVEVTIADNGLPTADAGTDANVAGGAPVTLDGSDSSDPETIAAGGAAGEGLTYQWTDAGGAVVATAATYTFTAPDATAEAQPLTFRLVVTDEANQASAPAEVTITVNGVDGPALSGSIGPFTFAAVTATNTETLPAVDDGTGLGEIDYTIVETLPDGLSFDDTDRTISGAPTAAVPAGTGDYTYRATDADGRFATLNFDIIVTNDKPTADAGTDQNVAGGAPVTLDGSGSTDTESAPADNTAIRNLSYEWTPPQGVTLLPDNTAEKPEFTAPDAEADAQMLEFTLVVTDEANQVSASDEVTITVNGVDGPALSGSIGPFTFAAVTATNTETLPAVDDGTGLGEIDYTIVETLPDGLSFDDTDRTISGAPTAAVPAGTGSYTYRATDADGRFATLNFDITVTNDKPTADAGTDQNVAGGATVTLDGSNSSDPETLVAGGVAGEGLTYEWTTTESGVTLRDHDTATPEFDAPDATPDAQMLEFTLVVTDEANQVSASDEVTITVNGVDGPALSGSIGPFTFAAVTETVDETLPAVDDGTGFGEIGYTIEPALPSGLNFDDTSRKLTGSPLASVLQTATIYTYKAKDDDDREATIEFTIAVTNDRPIADAGPDETVTGGVTVVLNGDNSMDTESAPADNTAIRNLSYQWTDADGAVVATAATHTFTAPDATPDAQMLEFTLVVTDEANQVSASDEVTITVNGVDGPALSGSIGPFTFAAVTETVDETLPAVDDGTGFGEIDYSIDPALPSGLSFDDASRKLTGSPLASVLQTATLYTYKAEDDDDREATIEFTIAVTNDAPTADAGTDTNVAGGEQVTLDGSGSTDTESAPADNTAIRNLTYQWTPPQGVTLLPDNTAAMPEFTAPDAIATAQPLTFTLVVTDEANQVSASDEVTITVNGVDGPALSGSIGPFTFAAVIQAVDETLPAVDDGTGFGEIDYSIDPALPSGLSFDDASRKLTGSPLASVLQTATLYTYKAEDDDDREATIEFTIAVTNELPTADAGTDQNVAGGATVTLDGSNSSDPETLAAGGTAGQGLTYQWTTTESGVTLRDHDTATPEFDAPDATPDAQMLEFTLVVTDEANQVSASDEVTITVNGVDGPALSGSIGPFSFAAVTETVDETLPAVDDGTGFGEIGYTIEPALPSGLSFDDTSRKLTGSPLASVLQTATIYTYKAKDDDDREATIEFTIAVTNDAPTADAGDPQAVAGGATVTLDGSDSSDPETIAAGGATGEGLTYAWTTTESGVTLRDHDTATPEFDAPDATAEAQPLTFTLVVTDEANQVSASDEVTITVTALPLLTLAGATQVTEGDGAVTYTVTLAPVASETVTVDWSVADGTTSPADYTIADDRTLTFAAGETSKTFDVTIADDEENEGAETFTVSLSGPVGAQLGASSRDVTIAASDGPRLSVADTVLEVDESSGAGTLAVTVEPVSRVDLNLTYAVREASPASATADDFTAVVSATVTVPARADTVGIPFTVTGDNADEQNETFEVALLSVSGGEAVLGATTVRTVRILDDDSAPSFSNIGTPRTLTWAAIVNNMHTLDTVNAGTGGGDVSYALDLDVDLDGDGTGDLGWLAFDAGTRTVSGTPPADVHIEAGDDVTLTYTATDEGNNTPAMLEYPLVVTNDVPTANAGSPQSVAGGATVTLNGLGSSDPETLAAGGAAGEGLTYEWTTTESGVTLRDHDTATPEFDAPDATAEAQSLTFSLIVTDEANQVSASDDVIVTVNPVGAPVLSGPIGPFTWAAVTDTVDQQLPTVDTDTGFGEIAYSIDEALPNGLRFDATERKILGNVTADVVQDATPYMYRARDSVGREATHRFTIAVTNQEPVAEAGDPQAVAGGDPVTLNGSNSTDAESAPADNPAIRNLSYLWTTDSDVILRDHDTATPEFDAPDATAEAQSLTFTLVVTDEANQESAPAEVTITVNGVGGPQLTGSIGTLTWAAGVTKTETLPAVNDGTGLGEIGYTVTPALPSGLSFDDTELTISGAPLAGVVQAATPYTYTATDEEGRAAMLNFNIIVTNDRPTADAGPDQTVPGGVTVVLNGSNSMDTESAPMDNRTVNNLRYAWTTDSEVTLIDPTTMAPQFDAPDATAEVQKLTFTLVVTDEANQVSEPDSVIITIDSEETETQAPDEGNRETPRFHPLSFGDATIPNQFWSEGQTIAALDLPAAIGGIGEIRYTLDPDLPTGLSFNADMRRIEGTLAVGEDFPATAFTYTATDSAQPPAMVYLEFNIGVGASGPVADAGEDQTVVSSTLVTLDGRRSRDRETSTLEYRWFQVAGDPVVLEDRHTATPSFMAPTAVVRSQTLGFQLIVLDESRLSDTDEVMIVVEAPMLAIAGPFEVMEDVGEAVFTVTLSHSPGADVSAVVHARAVDNTARVAGTTGPPPDAPPVATASEDFVPTSLPLTFEAGATGADLSREFRVTILDDAGDEPDEIFTVALFRIDGALMEGLDRPSVTILDDDAPSFAGEVQPQVAFVGESFRLELPPINGVGPFVYGMDRELPGGLVLSVVAWQPTSPNPLGTLRNEGLSGDGLLDNGLLGNDASGNDVSGNDLNGDEPDGDLPDGLDIDPRRAVIEGTPTVTAPRSEFRVRAVSETTGDAVAMSFEFEVREAMVMAQTIPDQSFEAWVEVPPVTLPEASGGLGELRYRLSPAPPDGLVFNADTRTLSGLPTRARERTEYTLVATDERGAEVQTAFDIIITPGMDPVLAPIADFLANRADTLVSNQPRLIPLLKQPGEEGLKDYGFRASEGNRSASGAFTHSGLWAEVAGAWQETDTSESRQVFATLGYHYQFSEQILGGLMLQLDHMASDLNQGLGDIEGTGWLVGPYFVASLPDDPLFLEARVLVGESDNDVDIFGHGHGLRRDGEFNTERLLAQLRLEGEMILGGGTRIVPFLDLGYVEDDAKRFTDDTGRTAPGQKISLGRYETGLRFDFPILLETGSLRLSQELSYAYTDTDGGEYGASRTDARGRLTFELDYQRSESTRLWLETFYDGLGQSDMDSHGLKLGIEATFE